MKTIKIGKLELSGWKSISLFILSIIYWIAVSTQHLRVSDILTDWIVTPWGKFIPRDITIETGIVCSAVIFLFIIYQGIKGTRRIITISFWLFLIASVLFAFRFFINAPIEIIHFPQYTILSILLAGAFDPKRKKMPITAILFWVTLMGMIDELDQYLYLTRAYSLYLDFNDFFLNEIGAAIGLLLFYGFKEMDRPKIKLTSILNSVTFKTISGILIVFICLMIIGIIQLSPESKINYAIVINNKDFFKFYLEIAPGQYGSWQLRDLGEYNYTLGPLQGTLLMIAYGCIFSLYRYSINTSPFKLFRGKKKI